MDFPVTDAFVRSANHAQLHHEAKGAKQNWPASFVRENPDDPDGWVYRVDRDDIDPAAVEAALAAHVPNPDWGKPQDEMTARDRIKELVQQLDDATATRATFDALSPTQRQSVAFGTTKVVVTLSKFILRRFLTG